MYINEDLCLYKIRKDENKCARIFRPWDNQVEISVVKENAQDSTISTTTKDEELTNKVEDKFEDKVSSVANECCKVEEDTNTSFIGFRTTPIKKCAYPQNFQDSLTISSPVSDISCSTSDVNSIRSPVMDKQCLNKQIIRDNLAQTSPIYTRPCENMLSSPEMFMPTSSMPVEYLHDPYTNVNADLVQTNLAHQLGLPTNDPLLLESLAQGYALEEYARVLSQEQQAKLMAAKKQRPKKYKCPHCDVGFSNNGQLKGHIRIHTGERPFKCDETECGKTFTRNEELTRHKRIHSGLRPFPCSHCGKRFGRKDHLKKHSRTHFQPRGLYAVPVVLPFEAWASGQTNGYPFFPVMY